MICFSCGQELEGLDQLSTKRLCAPCKEAEEEYEIAVFEDEEDGQE